MSRAKQGSFRVSIFNKHRRFDMNMMAVPRVGERIRLMIDTGHHAGPRYQKADHVVTAVVHDCVIGQFDTDERNETYYRLDMPNDKTAEIMVFVLKQED